jgi:hypothetical protein
MCCFTSCPASPRESGNLAAVLLSAHRHLYVVVPRSRTTILPPIPRPGDRLGSRSGRQSTGHAEAHNCADFDLNIEPNNSADICWNNFSNNFSDDERHSAAYSFLFSSRRSSRRSQRHTCRRNRVHSRAHICRYFVSNFPANFSGYFSTDINRKSLRGIRPFKPGTLSRPSRTAPGRPRRRSGPATGLPPGVSWRLESSSRAALLWRGPCLLPSRNQEAGLSAGGVSGAEGEPDSALTYESRS